MAEHLEINFCRRCGSPLRPKQGGQAFRCTNDRGGHDIFIDPQPTVNVIFVSQDGRSVLLSERAIDPEKGLFDFPGGFVEVGETFEQAATRELAEELQLTTADFDPPRYLCSRPDVYHYGGEAAPILSVFFASRLNPNAQPKPSDDCASIRWLEIDTIDFSLLSGADTKYVLQLLQKGELNV